MMLQLGGSKPDGDGRASLDADSVSQQSPLLAPSSQQQPAVAADGGPGSPNLQMQQYGRQRTALPPSVIYKTSCEYFSWPLLEPQVRGIPFRPWRPPIKLRLAMLMPV